MSPISVVTLLVDVKVDVVSKNYARVVQLGNSGRYNFSIWLQLKTKLLQIVALHVSPNISLRSTTPVKPALLNIELIVPTMFGMVIGGNDVSAVQPENILSQFVTFPTNVIVLLKLLAVNDVQLAKAVVNPVTVILSPRVTSFNEEQPLNTEAHLP